MRLEITQKTDLALRALVALDGGTRLKGGELAELITTSTGYIAQVMNPLVQRGWVHSETGPTGGYELGVALADVSVLDLIESIEGPTDSGKCVLRIGPCPGDDSCVLHDAWVRARSALLEELAHTTLAQAISHLEVTT